MSHLYQLLAEEVTGWRDAGYPCPDYPVITEILEYQFDPDSQDLLFLRSPQMVALETYWYLRLIKKTPHISQLYDQLYKRKVERVEALDIPQPAFYAVDAEYDALIQRIKTDDSFVTKYKLQTVRETLTLNYPSYIFALTMGAGKTILIGTIIATEFAMAMEYPRANYPDANFVENALVFAPGTTIIQSLHELSEIPYDRILPLRLYNEFAPNLKITFTRTGEKDVPVIAGSSFNIVVTNTEKIRIQKENILKSQFKGIFAPLATEDEVKKEIANRRLQTIASLPHLAVFSDEAHHTYGSEVEKDLKKVRKTIDYLAEKTNLIEVVNTTGTPFYNKQVLKDVVIWYGLAEGIKDGILKEMRDGIQSYLFGKGEVRAFVTETIRDFFLHYKEVRLADGSRAKMAFYFPKTEDLEELRPVIEQELVRLGLDSSLVLRNTSASTKNEIDAFNRLNDPLSPHRVILLVAKGTEGWNCPSLFACALVRKFTTSNNFVLQASTRCLRQTPGNIMPARIYISVDNRATLDNQLKDTYGERVTIAELNKTTAETKRLKVKLRKQKIEPLYITVPITKVTRKHGTQLTTLAMSLHKPSIATTITLEVTKSSLDLTSNLGLKSAGLPQIIQQQADTIALESAAVELAALYRLDLMTIHRALAQLYPEGEIPLAHLNQAHEDSLPRQIERISCHYDQTTEYVEATLALIRLESWKQNSTGEYELEVAFKGADYVSQLRSIEDNPKDFGYHYAPYIFSSTHERTFYEQLLNHLKFSLDEVEDVFFTGGFTDTRYTDFYIEYLDTDGAAHKYFPDFIIRKKPQPNSTQPGPCLIVEIKESRNKAAVVAEIQANDEAKANTVEARKAYAAMRWVNLNQQGKGNHLDYLLIFDDELPLFSAKVIDFINPPIEEVQNG
ncbi:MAG: DEAD/DEAH box helicase family protein [Chloroflexi bacterium]|nr:DEAD/DEAH box helicase family protein [Chloroflexota bacterium]